MPPRPITSARILAPLTDAAEWADALRVSWPRDDAQAQSWYRGFLDSIGDELAAWDGVLGDASAQLMPEAHMDVVGPELTMDSSGQVLPATPWSTTGGMTPDELRELAESQGRALAVWVTGTPGAASLVADARARLRRIADAWGNLVRAVGRQAGRMRASASAAERRVAGWLRDWRRDAQRFHRRLLRALGGVTANLALYALVGIGVYAYFSNR